MADVIRDLRNESRFYTPKDKLFELSDKQVSIVNLQEILDLFKKVPEYFVQEYNYSVNNRSLLYKLVKFLEKNPHLRLKAVDYKTAYYMFSTELMLSFRSMIFEDNFTPVKVPINLINLKNFIHIEFNKNAFQNIHTVLFTPFCPVDGEITIEDCYDTLKQGSHRYISNKFLLKNFKKGQVPLDDEKHRLFKELLPHLYDQIVGIEN